jgi:hypothetical protein
VLVVHHSLRVALGAAVIVRWGGCLSSFEDGGGDEGVGACPPSFVVGNHRRWCMVGIVVGWWPSLVGCAVATCRCYPSNVV